MDVEPLGIEGAWTFTPRQFGDDRGTFLETFQEAVFSATTGHRLNLAQANLSVSAAGVVRGIHFADVPPGQAKYVTCAFGAVLDVVVDVRTTSPTYGRWETVLLDDVDRRSVYLCEGLGHAFMSLCDGATVVYSCSTPYAPERERGVHPLDPEIGIEWPTSGRDGQALRPSLSPKDVAAPTLAEAESAGLLPSLDSVNSFRGQLARSGGGS